MLILGLLLLACTAAFTGLALADNLSGGPDYNVTMLGHHIATMNSLAIFCAGLALALIFGLGCMMTMAGGVLHRRKSRKLSAARREAAATARERDALAARLEDTSTTSEPTAFDPTTSEPTAFDPAARPGDGEPGYATASTDPGESGAARVDTTSPGKPRHHARHLFGH
jgi:hypothetical protein